LCLGKRTKLKLNIGQQSGSGGSGDNKTFQFASPLSIGSRPTSTESTGSSASSLGGATKHNSFMTETGYPTQMYVLNVFS